MARRYWPVYALLLVAAVAGCQKVPLLGPTGSTISVSAASTVLAPGGSTQISATVVESGGTPVHDGTLVRFSATLGRLDPPEVETRGGTATTTFIAGTESGTAQVRATSGAATGGEGEADANVVCIMVGGAAATVVTVSASPSRVGPTGGTVTVVASAVDAAGNRLVGIPITFSTSVGSLSTSSAVTDANGEARVSLTTDREAVVTARVGDKSGTVTVTVATAGTVGLATAPATPLSGQPVTLTVTPAQGTSPRVVVNWGDGTTQDLGIVAAAQAVTHVYQRAGGYTITATSTADGASFTTATSVTVGSAAGLTLSEPNPTSPAVGQPVVFTVTPREGTSPRVVIDWGDGSSTDLGTVTAARTAAHAYSTSGTFIVTATATAAGDSFSTSRAVVVGSRTFSVTISSDTGASADRCQDVTFTATVAPSSETIVSYRWSITSGVSGEGETVTTTDNELTRNFEEGSKTISVTATNDEGRTGAATMSMTIRTTPTTPTSCPAD